MAGAGCRVEKAHACKTDTKTPAAENFDGAHILMSDVMRQLGVEVALAPRCKSVLAVEVAEVTEGIQEMWWAWNAEM